MRKWCGKRPRAGPSNANGHSSPRPHTPRRASVQANPHVSTHVAARKYAQRFQQ